MRVQRKDQKKTPTMSAMHKPVGEIPKQEKKMARKRLEEITVGKLTFLSAFDRNGAYTDPVPLSRYIEISTGAVIEVYGSDSDAEYNGGGSGEENASKRKEVEEDPGGYIVVESLDHGDQHAILQRFLASRWTENDSLQSAASAAYDNSIGRWKSNAPSEAVREYEGFRDQEVERLAKEFFRNKGFAVVWREGTSEGLYPDLY